MSAAYPVARSLEGRFGRNSRREGAELGGPGPGTGGCSAEGLSWAAGRRGAGAGGAGNLFNWAEREALPHPRDGARLGDPGDAGLAGARLACLARAARSASPCPGWRLRPLASLGFQRPGHCRRSSKYFLSRGAPPSYGYETCQPRSAHLYALSCVSKLASLVGTLS